MSKNQRFLCFKDLKEEEIEEKIQELVEKYDIISFSVIPAYTAGGGGNFLAPKVSFRYTIYAIVEETEIRVRQVGDRWERVDEY